MPVNISLDLMIEKEEEIRPKVNDIAAALWDGQKVRLNQDWEDQQRVLISPVKESGKGLITEVEFERPSRRSKKVYKLKRKSRLFAFYPSTEHAKEFALGAKNRILYNPGQYSPGSVGNIHLMEGLFRLRIEWAQASFKQGNPETLTRSLVSKYGGWKYRLMEYAFERGIDKRIITLNESSTKWSDIEYIFFYLIEQDPSLTLSGLKATRFSYGVKRMWEELRK